MENSATKFLENIKFEFKKITNLQPPDAPFLKRECVL
jgi:hypothetical protein